MAQPERTTNEFRQSTELSGDGRRRGILLSLAALVVARLMFHAFFVPAWEGPDEPWHLARIAAFADRPWGIAFRGEPVDASIVADISRRPCGPQLARYHPCPPFHSSPAAFNLIRPLPKLSGATAEPNRENNQPPLFYLAAGLPLRIVRPAGLWTAPESRLLFARLFCVLLVAAALVFPLRRLTAEWSFPMALAGLLALLLPGAAESLSRCANDCPVFFWSAAALASVRRRSSTPVLGALLAAGPLLKQTAFPVAAACIAALWLQGRRRTALLGLASASLVVPIQLLRGWKWGGNYELNRPLPAIAEPAGELLLGLLRSAYTFVKTTFWLGEWSFFRPPTALVAAYFFLFAALLVSVRRRRGTLCLADLVGVVVATAGIVAFFLANRRFFGVWGGVGGWYVWGWAPWLALAASDCLRLSERRARMLLAAAAAFVLVANILYFRAAWTLYRN